MKSNWNLLSVSIAAYLKYAHAKQDVEYARAAREAKKELRRIGMRNTRLV